MIVLIALISAIGIGLRIFRQGWAVPSKRDVVDGPRRVVRYGDDPALFGDNDLVLDGMALPLPEYHDFCLRAGR